MATYVNLDTVQRPSVGTAVSSAWGDQVNDNFTALTNPSGVGQVPSCQVRLGTNQALTATGFTMLNLNTAINDPLGMLSASNFRVIIPVQGYYEVHWNALLATAPASRYISSLYVNGAERARGTDYVLSATEAQWGSGGSDVQLFNPGSYLQVAWYTSSSLVGVLQASGTFVNLSVVYLGPS